MNSSPLIAPDLRRLFRAIAHTTLASGWLAACADDVAVTEADVPPPADAATTTANPDDAGSSSSEGSASEDGNAAAVAHDAFERVLCSEGIVVPSGELRTPHPIHAMGIYTQIYAGAEVAWPGGRPPFTVSDRARSGVMCAGAADSAACEEEVRLLSAEPGPTLPCQIAIAAETGGLKRVASRAELVRIFGDIDTADEAILLASFEGYRFCAAAVPGSPLDVGAEVRTTSSGYEIRMTHEDGGCSGKDLKRTLLRIDATGMLTVASVELVRSIPCP